MCAYCEKLPTAEALGFKLNHRSRHGRALVYEAFRNRGKLTIDEIRMIIWPNGETRNDGTINVFISRMERALAKHDLTILKGVGKDSSTYRLGPA
jgi:hypothetical protein